MKLQLDKGVQIESTDQVKSGQFGISEKGLQVIIRGFTDTIYKNKIGTIVREIVSNAWDANKESGTDKPVIVHIGEDEFSIQDFGFGMSPRMIEEVYTKYGESTKRKSDDYHGAFGIGAKSPLSYNDFFTVITYWKNIKYTYLITKSDNLPEYRQVDITREEGQGTKIVINYKENRDIQKFKTECSRQLQYFDNIFYTGTYKLENEYKLRKMDNFIYNSATTYNELHICLGKVTYPLPEQITPIFNMKNLPIGLTFNIGELPVTMSREDIKIDEEVLKKINDKITICYNEIKNLYLKEFKKIDNYIEYFLEGNKVNKAINLDGVILNINNIHLPNNFGYSGRPFPVSAPKVFSDLNKSLTITLMTKGKSDKKFTINDFNEYKNLYYTEKGILPKKTLYINQLIGDFYLVKLENRKISKDRWDSKYSISEYPEVAKFLNEEMSKYFKSYDDVVIPDDFVYKPKGNTVIIKDQIPIHSINNSTIYNHDISKYLNENRNTTIVYGFKHENSVLRDLYEILNKDHLRNKINIISIAKKNAQYFTGKNHYHVSDFIDKPFMLKYIAFTEAYRKFPYVINNIKYFRNNIEGISDHLYHKLKELSSIQYLYYSSRNPLFLHILDNKKDRLPRHYFNLCKEVDSLLNNLPLLTYYIRYKKDHVIDYLRCKKIKLNFEYYAKRNQNEQQSPDGDN